MKFVGVDLHKQSISVCVVDQARQVLQRRRFLCADTASIREFFASLGEFRFVVEATGSYEWFFRLVEPLAEAGVLAHPAKLRVIAESTRKSDRRDAQLLAEFLAADMIPPSYRPTPRQREHRRLTRQRDYVQRRITAVKNRLRRILSDDNADRPDLFTAAGLAYLERVDLTPADRFAADQLRDELDLLRKQLAAADRQLQTFAQAAPAREAQRRALLRSIPGVGPVTTEVVLAELAEPDRFTSQKKVAAYAGLCPGQRESAGKRRELHISKQGSRHLRWVLVQAAWQLVRRSGRWKGIYEALKARLRAKKAIVAVARRLLGLMLAILHGGRPYDPAYRPAA